MEQNNKPRNRPVQIGSITEEQRPLNGQGIVFSTSGMEQLDSHMQKKKKNLDSFTKINSKLS